MKKLIYSKIILFILLILILNTTPIKLSSSVDKNINQNEIIIILQIGNRNIYINENQIEIDTTPQIIEGRTLLPIRYIVEPIGGTVFWDSIEEKVTIILKDITIEQWIGKNLAKVNGYYKLIDPNNPKVVPLIINGRTMLPVRFVSENLGCEVQWENIKKLVKIIYKISNENIVLKMIIPELGGNLILKNGAKLTLPPDSINNKSIITMKIIDNPKNYNLEEIFIGNVYNISITGGDLINYAILEIPIPINFLDKNLAVCTWDNVLKTWIFEGGEKLGNFIRIKLINFSIKTIIEIKDLDTGFSITDNAWNFVNGGSFVGSFGLCFGMTVTSGKLFEQGIKIPKVCNPYCLTKEVQDFIKDAQWEFEQLYSIYWDIFPPKNNSIFSIIYDQLYNNIPVIIILENSENKKHAILAYSMENYFLNDELNYKIFVYDPNYPCEENFINLKIKKTEDQYIFEFDNYEDFKILGAIKLSSIKVAIPNDYNFNYISDCEPNFEISSDTKINLIEKNKEYKISFSIKNNSNRKNIIYVDCNLKEKNNSKILSCGHVLLSFKEFEEIIRDFKLKVNEIPKNDLILEISLKYPSACCNYNLVKNFVIYEINKKEWQHIGLENKEVRSIAIDPYNPDIIYTATFGDGVYKSVDRGKTWIEKNNGIDYKVLMKITIDPNNSNVIYTNSYKSLDGGNKWFNFTFDFKYYKPKLPGIDTLEIDPKNTNIIYCGTVDGLYKSIDSATSFFLIGNGLENYNYYTGILEIAVDSVNTNTLYVFVDRAPKFSGGVVFADGIFKSNNGGLNFQKILDLDKSEYVESIIIDPKNNNIIYISTSYHIYKSIDGGNTWKIIDKNIIYRIVLDYNQNVLYGIGRLGEFYKSYDKGESWVIDNNFENINFYEITISTITYDNKNRIIYLGTYNGIYKLEL